MLDCQDSLTGRPWQGRCIRAPPSRRLTAWQRSHIGTQLDSSVRTRCSRSAPATMPTRRRRTVPPNASRTRSSPDTCQVDVVHLDAVTTARASLPAGDDLEWVAGLIAMLSNPTRLRMLLALQPARLPRAELCVCDLAVVSEASKSMTSHQLRLLRAAGLVRHRRSGRLTYYRLAEGPLLLLLEDLASLATSSATMTRSLRQSTA